MTIIVGALLSLSAFLLLPSVLQPGPVVLSCVGLVACVGNTGHVESGLDNSGDIAKNGKPAAPPDKLAGIPFA